MEEAGGRVDLDAHLSGPLRAWLEERFWRPIEAQATLESVIQDPDFARSPGTHPAMFADHGVVHARDVASGVVRLMDTVDGVLLPRRTPERRAFVEVLGVALAYIHDIGMIDMSTDGRRTHALFAAHAAFAPDIEPLVGELLAPGPVRGRLDEVAASAPFPVPLEIVVREMLAMAVAHSKSAVPAPVLEDRTGLRALLQRVLFTPLALHRAADRLPVAADGPPDRILVHGDRYVDPAASFAWLDREDDPHAGLADDVIDAVRVLRAADVLRQRGSVLRTSGGFELFIDAATARCVCTLRSPDGDAAYVIAYDDDQGAGEANLRVAFVTPQGDLRLAFHRGAFGSPEAADRAAHSVAGVVLDIVRDVFPSFAGSWRGGGLGVPARPVALALVQLERPDDRPEFAADVAAIMGARDPSLAGRVVTVSDVETAAPGERLRYHAAAPVDGTGPFAREVITRLADHGADTSGMDPETAFAEARRASIAAGEVLVASGSPPAFVYVPTADGLVVLPDGGYAPAALHAWVPVGTTGAIRRAERNADIVAEREVEVLMIPADRYTRDWLRPLRPAALAALAALIQHPPESDRGRRTS